MRSVRLLVEMSVPADVTDSEAASLVDQATTRSLSSTGVENPDVVVSPMPDLRDLTNRVGKLGVSVHEMQVP